MTDTSSRPRSSTPPAADAAARRAAYTTGLLWHVGAFAIINLSFWLMDLALGQDGLQWAPWITVFWAFALAFHVLAWLIDGRQVESRLADTYRDQHHRPAH